MMLSGSPRHTGRREWGLATTCSRICSSGVSASMVSMSLAVGHDLADLDLGEIEDAAEHVALLLAHAAVRARGDDVFAQLLAGEHVAVAGLRDPEAAQNRLRCPVQQPN